MKILGTGLSGLVGTRIVELLSTSYEFEDLSLETEFNILDHRQIVDKIADSDAKIVLHLAAKTDVDGCELDKNRGKKGETWFINVEATDNIAKACARFRKKLIYFSTDFIFDGKKPPYNENSTPNPLNWYGVTKHEGEERVKKSAGNFIICRITYPYCAFNKLKKDFFHNIKEKLEARQTVLGLTDHIFTPTLIDDIAKVLNLLIRGGKQGIFHIVGSQSLSPFEACLLLAKAFFLDAKLIEETTMEKFFKGRAPRPFHLITKNDKITSLGMKMSSFNEGISIVREQMLNSQY